MDRENLLVLQNNKFQVQSGSACLPSQPLRDRIQTASKLFRPRQLLTNKQIGGIRLNRDVDTKFSTPVRNAGDDSPGAFATELDLQATRDRNSDILVSRTSSLSDCQFVNFRAGTTLGNKFQVISFVLFDMKIVSGTITRNVCIQK